MTIDGNAQSAGRAMPLPSRDLARRIAVTIAVLVVYRLASLIPAPGINPDALGNGHINAPGFSAVTYVSMLAIGLIPAFSIYAIFEFSKLAFEDLRDWGAGSAEGARNRERGLAIVILALAAIQAYGVAVGLMSLNETMPGRMLIVESRASFVTGFIVSNVAGTALLLWLASIVTRHGIGSGFWVLFLFPSLMAYVTLPAEILERTRIGELSPALPFAIAAVMALIAAAAITLARRWLAAAESSPVSSERDGNARSDVIGALVWPGFLATAVSGLLASAINAFNSSGQPMALAGAPAMLVISALLIFFVTYRYVHVHIARTPSERTAVRGLLFATAVTAALAYVIVEVLTWHFGAPASLSSLSWIAILAVLTPLLPRDVSPYLRSSSGEPPITDADFEQR